MNILHNGGGAGGQGGGGGADSRQLPGLISVSGRQGSRLRDLKRVIRSQGRGFERRTAAPRSQLQPAYASSSLGKRRSGPFEGSRRPARPLSEVLGSARESGLFTERLAVPPATAFPLSPEGLANRQS